MRNEAAIKDAKISRVKTSDGSGASREGGGQVTEEEHGGGVSGIWGGPSRR